MDKRIDSIRGFIFPDECEEIERNALQVRPYQNVVEIGSYLGKSTAIIASSLPNHVEFHAIDTWNNDAMTEGQKDTWTTFIKNIDPWKHKVIAHKGTSHEISEYWYKPIDLLFIDADHSYEAVLSDLNDWYKYLRTGGVLLMHDYTYKVGVKKAFDEFFDGKPELKSLKVINSLARVIKS